MKVVKNMEEINETSLDKNKSTCPLTSQNSENFSIKENGNKLFAHISIDTLIYLIYIHDCIFVFMKIYISIKKMY